MFSFLRETYILPNVPRPLLKIFTLALFPLAIGSPTIYAQVAKQSILRPTLGLDQGLTEFDTPDFHIKLVKTSQTLAALEPRSVSSFDFTPADRINLRSSNGFYHLGDIVFTVRIGRGSWATYSTALD